MLVTKRGALIKSAAEAAIVLDRQLNILLDAYDFYVTRYPADTPSAQLELRDLQVSIKELGTLPHQVASRLEQWRHDQDPTLSKEGFEVHVLNEFSIHLHALSFFIASKGIDLEPFDGSIVGHALMAIRAANREI